MLDLTEDEFKRLVNNDIRENVRPQQAKELRQPENIQRWYNTLLEVKLSTESQLSHDRADRSSAFAKYAKGEMGEADYASYLAERDGWRANVLHFKAGIERKIAEAKHLRQKYAGEQQMSRYRIAIERHRMALCNTDEYTSVDEDLWRVLAE